MNLSQLHDLANSGSYFSRTDAEIYQAISSAAKKVYLWTARESRGYFLKDDNGLNLSTAANTEEVTCPPDLSILIRLGEQVANSAPLTPWSWMRPADVNSDQFIMREFGSLIMNTNSPSSNYVFYGPYLDMTSAKLGQGANPQGPKKIRLAPIPIDVRPLRFVYAAQFLEITNSQSILMIPFEAHEAILEYAKAELVRLNGDAMAATFEEAGKDKFQNDFLPFYRKQQQIQEVLTQEPYIGDLS